MTRPPPRSTLFPYTTLFRSSERQVALALPARCERVRGRAADRRRSEAREGAGSRALGERPPPLAVAERRPVARADRRRQALGTGARHRGRRPQNRGHRRARRRLAALLPP